MSEPASDDYTPLDRPEILRGLFHPRPELPSTDGGAGEDLLIPVADGAAVGARFHPADVHSPTLLFFHGNGEIVADYDDLARVYTRVGINFLPVDYRGYGRSTGEPSVSGMMADCHVIFDFVRPWLKEHGCSGPLMVMGRSLGSASALEIAYQYHDAIDALIVESGFASIIPLLERLGLDPDAVHFKEEKGRSNLYKITHVNKPTLIIHAKEDEIIPFSNGEALFDASPSPDKHFLEIPGAGHNDIFMRGLSEYMAAVSTLAHKLI